MSCATVDNISERGQAYTALVEAVRRRGEGSLHKAERELLFDAADALLFDEPEATDKRQEAGAMIEALVESGRWTESAAGELSDQLSRISG